MPKSRVLLVMRHAKSDWGDPGLEDHERPLNRRGERDAPRMARWLAEKDTLPDFIATSSAKRAQTTAERLVSEWNSGLAVHVVPQLYLAGPETYLEAAANMSENIRTALLIGHNPGVEEIVELLTAESVEMPTAAIAEIRLDIGQWNELTPETTGKLKHLWRPKELPDDFA